MTYLSRLSADLKFEIVYDGLYLNWSRRVAFCVMKDNCQYKGAGVFFDRHPFIGQQYAYAPGNCNAMMIVIYQLRRLFRCANGDGLVWIDLVEIRWAGHEMLLLICFRPFAQ